MKKCLPIIVVGILVLSGLGAVATNDEQKTNMISESITFSEPIIIEESQYVKVDLDEATSYLNIKGEPALPVVSKTYTFPFGTKIESVDVTFSDTSEQVISKDVMPALGPQYISTEFSKNVVSEPVRMIEVYSSEEIYPETIFDYRTGAGLDNGNHVVFLSVHYYPISYSPTENTLYIRDNANIEISYNPPENPINFPDAYDLLIIAPSEFSEELQPLVDFKNDNDVPTILATLDEIPSQGVDEQEDIKYFIKDAIEDYGITYVLLVGAGIKDEELLPVRYAWIPSMPYEDSFPSDLYYADIYDSEGNFSTWDNDSDGRYCEYPADEDAVDIYPDVYLARLPCNDESEVKDAVNKIKKFMQKNKVTKKIVQMGGDTFPGDGENINEGEYANERVLEVLPGYTSKKLWGSNNKLTKLNIILGISFGADFVDFSGHGSVVSWATHPPSDDSVWIPKGIQYTGFLYIHTWFLFNFNKLPVVVLNACSTSKFAQSPNCLSWEFIKKKIGGAIATIGASGIGYGSQGSSETSRLFGWMELHLHEQFFNTGILGDSWGNCITEYANSFPMDDGDFKTVVEMALFGDPSLDLGTAS